MPQNDNLNLGGSLWSLNFKFSGFLLMFRVVP